jgi:hypothetical protein
VIEGGRGSKLGRVSAGGEVVEGGRGTEEDKTSAGNRDSVFETGCVAGNDDIEDERGARGGIGEEGKGVSTGKRRASGSSSICIGAFVGCEDIAPEMDAAAESDLEFGSGLVDGGLEEVTTALEELFEQDLVGLNGCDILRIGADSSV